MQPSRLPAPPPPPVKAMEMGTATERAAPLRVFFIPFFSHSHALPMAELAYQFAARGADSTMLVTPADGASIRSTVERAARAGLPMRLLHFPFPSVEVGLPAEGANDATVHASEIHKLLAAAAVRDTHARILGEHRPDAVVADFCFRWANEVAEDLGIPRVFFDIAGAFPNAVIGSLLEHRPHDGVADGDDTPFLVPGLPDRVEMVASELPSYVRARKPVTELVWKSRRECFGVVMNTFYELEPTYCDLTRRTACQRAWFCGPLTLWPRAEEEQDAAAAKGHPCIAWLDEQATGSVVYVGFGSFLNFSKEQHQEMARGLEASGRPFLWVLKESNFAWLPEGFEERARLLGRCLVVKGWVPQTAILSHPAVGAFLTHLGWNSLNEGLRAGLPMITWPLAFEQFFTERLVVDIVRIGLRTWEGFRRNLMRVAEAGAAERALVKGEDIARVVSRFAAPGSADEEVEAMRRRAGEYGNKLRAAVFFIPFFIPTHTIPVTELACQFAARGVEATMVLTPANAALLRGGLPVRTLLYPFPSVEVGLPEGVEDAAPLLTGEVTSIYRVTAAVRGAHERILREHRPDAVVADFPFCWMNDITEDLHIPRVFYHVCGAFPSILIARISEHRPHAQLPDGDNGPFLVPNLPDRVEMVKSELPRILRVSDSATAEHSGKMVKSQRESFGVILNTIYELEPAYVELFGRTQCRQVWCCGPCTLWPTDDQEQAAAEKSHPCMAWLDKQAATSVVYAAFGSSFHFSKEQHREMARGLEASGRPFLWAVKESVYAAAACDGWLAEEFEDNVRGRGLVVRDRVPQKAILNHPAVGAFVSQLGWNSLTEGLHAGLPIITWPLAFEQFFTDRLVVDVLRVGVRMWEGFRRSLPATDQDCEATLVKGEAIARVVSRFAAPGSADEEVEAMRKKAGEYGAMIRAAVREGGSSYKDLERVIDALKATRTVGGK
ncbi:hypothetical protein Taro_037899 [Colocasia esculenta]|uniref:Uncharacterized protein n=1 Tax=Colocasia esculenta TaxID=4460 RepID=A0A843WR31_COLES|nr:hypothetical protein [Colocasia esculenta]